MKIVVLVILCIFNLSMYIKYLYNNLINYFNEKCHLTNNYININLLFKLLLYFINKNLEMNSK